MSEIPPLADANVRSHTYYVARTHVRCWHCGLSTRLLALAVPHNHEPWMATRRPPPTARLCIRPRGNAPR